MRMRFNESWIVIIWRLLKSQRIGGDYGQGSLNGFHTPVDMTFHGNFLGGFVHVQNLFCVGH